MSNMDERRTVANNIKKLREAMGCTQNAVAEYLGIGRSAYSNYETGDRELPLEHMEKLADFYGCDAYDLYSTDADVVANMLVTAFRADDLTPEDMNQIAAFKRIVRNSLMMDSLLAK